MSAITRFETGDRVQHINRRHLAGTTTDVRRDVGRMGCRCVDMITVRWDDGHVFDHAADLLVALETSHREELS